VLVTPHLCERGEKLLWTCGFLLTVSLKISRKLLTLSLCFPPKIPHLFFLMSVEAYNRTKEALTIAAIIQPLDRSLPFKILCDASDHEVGAVL